VTSLILFLNLFLSSFASASKEISFSMSTLKNSCRISITYSDERFAKKLFELLGFGKLQTLMTPSHFFALVNRNLFLKSLQSRKHRGDRAAVRRDREKVEKEEKVSKRRRFNNPILPY
jgi:hypothetical protein